MTPKPIRRKRGSIQRTINEVAAKLSKAVSDFTTPSTRIGSGSLAIVDEKGYPIDNVEQGANQLLSIEAHSTI